MFNRKRYSGNTSYLNEAFKEIDNINDDVLIKVVADSVIQNDASRVDINQGLDKDTERDHSNSLSDCNMTTTNQSSKVFLHQISEETASMGLSLVNSGFDDMSLSNFKMVQGGKCKDRPVEKRRSDHNSEIFMRNSMPEMSVQTGPRFKKMSTFVITPGATSSSYSDFVPYETGEEKYGIKFMDTSNVPELFIEFDSLQLNQTNQKYYWVERFRWLRYEEYYNPEVRRFDNPHLSPLSMIAIANFRKLFATGETVLDCHQVKFVDVLKNIIDSISNAGTFTSTEIEQIQNSLMLRHFHAGELMNNSKSTNAMYSYDKDSQCFKKQNQVKSNRSRSSSFKKFELNQIRRDSVKLDGRLENGTEALSVQVGALAGLEHTVSLFVRLDPAIEADGLNEINCPLRFIFIIFGPKSNEEELMEVGRVFAVMMSNLEFREVGYTAKRKEDLLDASSIFINHSVLVPLNKVMTSETLAAMLPQMKQYGAYFQAQNNQRKFDEIREDMINKNQDITLDHFENGIRRRVPLNTQRLGCAHLLSDAHNQSAEMLEMMTLSAEQKKVKVRQLFTEFCLPFYHFIMDWKGLRTRYASDYKDAFKRENVSTVFIGIFFIYFVVLSPAITFGALLNSVYPQMTVSLMLVACGFYQFIYSLLSGQPLEVVGITGPVFVVEKILRLLAIDFQMEPEVMKFWIAIYVAIMGLAFTSFNGVIIIKHFRRSVEEVYNFLVAAIFILSAFFSMFRALPYHMTPLDVNRTNAEVIVQERLKFGIGGTTLFLAFFMANFCIILVKIKRGSFFRRRIRNLLGSFNVPLGILLIFAMERIFFKAYSMPTLNVPPSNIINTSRWFNAPVFSDIPNVSVQAHGFCFLISLSLFAILITEVSTNSISTTKTERKLVKPSLFSLNYFYILVIFPVISGLTGWPFVSGAMVRSNAHCLAMSKWSTNLPGVPSKVTGAVEQRISGIFVGLLVFMSVFLGSILHYIPMASMYGMFLYMGIMGARDLVFMRRLISILQLRKYWGTDDFLKDYPTWNIAVLILIQSLFIGILIILNCLTEFTAYSWATLLFPLFVGLYAVVRGYVLPKWPRLNTHLSKMDKKHPVKLYADQQALQRVLLTVDESGVNMKVVKSDSFVMVDEHQGIDDYASELDKYW